MDERDVLEEQLEDLLAAGATDAEDALEIALVAGMAARLSASPELLRAARVWSQTIGKELLEEAWPLVDLDALQDSFDEVLDGQHTDEEVEEALFDVDELVAAAIWCGQEPVVRGLVKEVTASIRMMPDLFSPLQPEGAAMVQLGTVGSHYDLYDYWFAIASIPDTDH